MGRSQPSSLHDCQSGAVLVESTICLGAFLFVLILACDVLRLTYLQLSLQHAVQMTTSWAALGEVKPGETRVDTIKNELIRRAGKLGLRLEKDKIWICAAPTIGFCAVQSAGAPRTAFQITAVLPADVLLFRKRINLEFDSQGRNEPS